MPSGISGPLSPERKRLRARKGVAVRLGRTDDADQIDTEIRAARLADQIRADVDAWPPLTTEQCERLASLLHPSAKSGTSNA